MGRITHRKEGIPNHKLQKNLQLNGNYLSNDGGNEGIKINDSGHVELVTIGDYPAIHALDHESYTLKFYGDTNDYFKIAITGSGVTRLSTVDAGGLNDGKMIFEPQGNVVFSPVANKSLQANIVTKTASSNHDNTFSCTEVLNLGSGEAGGSDVHYGIRYVQTQTDLAGWNDVYLMHLAGGGDMFSVDESALLNITTTGTAKSVTDVITITNDVNAADMDGTGSAIKFNQWAYDGSSPATEDAAKIAVATELDWTVGDAATRDSYMSFFTSDGGTLAEKLRITSGGNVGIGVDAPTALLEVEQGSSGGGIAFKIDNDDTDQIAMSIEAANIDADVIDISADAITTVNVIDITADGLTSGKVLNITSTGTLTGSIIDITADSATTGKGINISMDALTSGNMLYLDDNSASTTARNCVSIIQNNDAALDATALLVQSDAGGTGMKIDKNYPAALVAADTVTGLHVDFDHTVPSSGTATQTDIGIDLDVNSATLGTSTTYGMDIDVVGATSGTHTVVGIAVDVGSADTNYAALFNGGNVGIGVADPDTTLEVFNGSDVPQLKLSYDADSYAVMEVASNSDLRIESEGNMRLEVSRYLYLNSNGDTTIGAITIDLLSQPSINVTSNDNSGNYFNLEMADDGVTTMSTVNYNGAVGHLNIEADGHVEFDNCAVGFDKLAGTYSTSQVISDGGASTDIDLRLSNKYELELTGNMGATDFLNFIFPATSGNFLLVISQDGTGSRTVHADSWVAYQVDGSTKATNAAFVDGTDGDLRWAGGSAPTLTTSSDKQDIISIYWDADNQTAFAVASLAFS